MAAAHGPSEAAAQGAMKLAVLVRSDDSRGFILAGARVETAPPGEELSALRALLTDPALGVVAVQEEVLASVPPRVLRRARERGVPVLLPFTLPRSYGEAGRGREYVAALIRRAIGYAVRLAGPGGRGP
ncbi:MAG TPA: V-type ATP synthase subunit F [Anaeromyxobacteraceae bacterium]|nr:V-type ATP synthase subunit F [Anaeromyxobacteraceae bacterium]